MKVPSADHRFQFPKDPESFLRSGQEFWTKIQDEKRKLALPGLDWYPFETLSCLPTVAELISRDFDDFAGDIAGRPVADIGCGDGDFGMLLAHWGAHVDAVDHVPNNFNRMQGVAALAHKLGLPVQAHDIDLDHAMNASRQVYGLALFLGTLYHLKNPYGLLERLAYQTRWCILSTRIAQVTPSRGVSIETEPVAYLVDGREVANDATNYWIFTSPGLLRILQRTRWAIVATKRVGCTADSDPINSDRDERMFVLLKSRVHFPDLHVRLIGGWHPVEQSFYWTAKHFSIEVVLPLETPLSGFSLAVVVPPATVVSGGTVLLSCRIRDQVVGTTEYRAGGSFEFVGTLPPFALHEPVLRLDFAVESDFSPPPGDCRELGICVPCAPLEQPQISFRVS